MAMRRPMRGSGKVKAPRKPSEPMDNTLDRLKDAISQIHSHNASQLSFEEHYRYAYTLVLHKKGHLLYNAVAELIASHLESETKTKIVPTFPHAASASIGISGSSTVGGASGSSGGGVGANEDVSRAAEGQLFLDRLRDVWDDHTACMSKLKDVLKYLDKFWAGSANVPKILELGDSLFFHHVVLYSTSPKPAPPLSASSSSRNPPSASIPTPRPTADPTSVAHHLISTLLTQIRIERSGEVVSRSAIQSVVEILCSLTDQGPVPLPIVASTGVGAGSPVVGGSTSALNSRTKTVMGEGTAGAQESPYKTSFEQALLKQTEEFYRRESERLLVECDCPSFLQKIHRRLSEEQTRARSYLSSSTEPLLLALLDRVLIASHLTSIITHPSAGLSTLIQDERIEDLKLMYQLFGRVEAGPAELMKGISEWIVRIGKGINEEPTSSTTSNESSEKGKEKETGEAGTAKKKGPSEAPINPKTKVAIDWVASVLSLKDKFDRLLLEAFADDKAFEKTINDAFSVFVNENRKSPEYISLFIDENLRKGLKGKTETEVDEVLNKSVALFRFLSEKDAFEKYYNGHLSRRLISQRSVSDDAERNMLAKFKIEAGAAFTKSAEGMMKDVKISEDTLEEYKRYQDSTGKRAPFEMAPIICGSNNWPSSSKDSSCTFPRILQDGIASFQAFYDKKHSGRKLTFRPDMGTVEVKAKFKARSHELNVSTHSMIVLALFEGLEDDEKLSYIDISNSTNMVAAELKRTLQSLACAKYKVLSKFPKGRDINETDSFSYNSSFSAPINKIKIQTVVNKIETAEERQETDSKVEEGRNTQCEACIVRVMKDRKTLAHQQLISDTISQLSHRFTPSVQMIKRAIERLIDKEYLERHATDRKLLNYLA
ncbi:cullin family protein [Sporobolomyces salmoneus]|uniref:cullin family protein n=1 Tax=Sporobolomyces salmoneus TaxID=183962 RepID=UPI003174C368